MSAIAVALWTLTGVLYSVGAQACPPGELCNPLKYGSLQEFIAELLRLSVAVATPVLGFFIVYAGFKFVLAQGKETALKEAKINFQWVLVGAVLILGAWALSELIGGTIDQLR